MTVQVANNGAAAIFEVLRGWGVRYVFTCPGTTEAAFLDASFAYPDISVMTTTHESIAVAMADGYARVTRKPAVAYLHTNVGLTNGLAHLSAAQIAHSPVIILNGLKSTRIQNRGGFTTATAMRDFVRQYVKSDWLTLRADAIGEDLNRALKIATAEPQGPTYLGIAQDMLAAETQIPIPPATRYQVAARTRPDPDQVAMAVQLLAQAAHPLIIAGDEVTQTNAGSELIALAEHLKAPVLVEDRTTLESCPFPPSHPHYIGLYASTLKAVKEADVIILAGSRTFMEFDWKDTPALPPDTPLIHLSSSAAEIAKIYPTDVPLVGNAKLGLADLLLALSQQPLNNSSQRQDYLRSARDSYLEATQQAGEEAAHHKDTVPVRVSALMQTLAQLLTPHTMIVADPVTSAVAAMTHLFPRVERNFYTTASGSLGWGMGAALGVKLAMPDKEVIALVGDGVFQFGIQALWTAVHYKLPVIFIVINNQSYAAVKAALYRYNGVAVRRQEFPAVDIAGPRVADIGWAFGAVGLRIESLADLAPALQTVREQGNPAVIEVMTDTNDAGPIQR
ncbi:MAG: thiamine pyrophosphate-binding protein [Chloroflexi bacterium]|nr:thiamine pyrophosphate-binding protein [Chloroflexota bacterium]